MPGITSQAAQPTAAIFRVFRAFRGQYITSDNYSYSTKQSLTMLN